MGDEAKLVELTAQLAASAELAALDTGTSELRLIHKTLHEQPSLFGAYIRECSPKLYSNLSPYFENGMRINVHTVYPDENDSGLRDEDYAVYYQRHQGTNVPVLMITTAAIERAYGQFEPLFSGEDESKSRQYRLAGAAAVTAWMALGKWAFDCLDPRSPDKELERKLSYDILQYVGNMTREECLALDDDEQIDQAVDFRLLELRYRLMGLFAYAGFMKEIEHLELIEPTPSSLQSQLGVFRKMYPTRFAMLAKIRPERVTALEVALARPLEENDAQKIMRSFGELLN